MIILIDNYDSFTFNVYHYLSELGAKVKVYRNDEVTPKSILEKNPKAIIISPGPKTPNQAGICLDLIKLNKDIPVLGICLGHQSIGQAYGGLVVQADEIKHGKIDGFASAGNTGAMFVGGYMSVKPIAGVLRPCISSVLPKEDGGVNIILDVGANADCKPDVLYQFGILGSLFAEYVCGINNPKVGLLNIGEEETKGNMLTTTTHEMMKDSSHFNFDGNIESRDIFGDHADVIVCDGFTGNVVLKEAEAFYTLIKKRKIEDEYFNRFNYENYGGTPILGLNKSVVIGHGISNNIAIKNMIVLTADVVEADLPSKIKNTFNNE